MASRIDVLKRYGTEKTVTKKNDSSGFGCWCYWIARDQDQARSDMAADIDLVWQCCAGQS